jgi:hypothetical protein
MALHGAFSANQRKLVRVLESCEVEARDEVLLHGSSLLQPREETLDSLTLRQDSRHGLIDARLA